MPAALEKKLGSVAAKYARQGKLKKRKGETTKEAKAAYKYGTLRKIELRHRAKGGKPGKYLKKV